MEKSKLTPPQNEIQHVLSGKQKIGKIKIDYMPTAIFLKDNAPGEIEKILESGEYNGTPYAALLNEIKSNAPALSKNFEIIERAFLGVLDMRLRDSIGGGCFYYFTKIMPDDNGEGGNIIFSNEIEKAVDNIRQILIAIADKIRPLCDAYEIESEAAMAAAKE